MLTDTQVRGVKHGELPRRIADRGGFYVQVDPSEGSVLAVQLSVQRQAKTLALGVYPDVPLAAARLRLAEARALLAKGIDPSTRK